MKNKDTSGGSEGRPSVLWRILRASLVLLAFDAAFLAYDFVVASKPSPYPTPASSSAVATITGSDESAADVPPIPGRDPYQPVTSERSVTT